MAHMLDTTYWYCYFNTPTNEQIQEFILWQFESMWYKYNHAAVTTLAKKTTKIFQGMTPSVASQSKQRNIAKDILEISYSNTTAHLKQSIQDIYEHIGIPWSDALDAHFLAEENLLVTYRPNVHDESLLSDEMKALIRDRWGDYFDTFGYK